MSNKMSIQCKYENASDFSEGLARVMRDGKYGFIDTAGREVVPCKYDGADDFHEGMARVTVGGGWRYDRFFGESFLSGKFGFIDKTGREVIPCRYFHAENYCDGLAVVEVREDGESRRFLIDKSGREAGPYVNAIPGMTGVFHEGFAWVERNKKWGFVDKTGREVVPCKYDAACDFSDGMARVAVGGEWSFSEDLGEESLSGCKWGYLDKSGREVIPCQYGYACDFHDGLAMVAPDGMILDGSCFFIDKVGHEVFRLPEKVFADVFSEGLASYRIGNKSGYLDKTGQVAISARFDQAYDFHDGLAMVKAGRTWGFIDKTGQMVIEYKTEAPLPPVVDDGNLPF